jgi:signal transduction histidine kinase
MLATAFDVVIARDAACSAEGLAALLNERARIASVVHESVAQELATVSLQLEVLSQLVAGTPQVQELANLTRATTRRAIATVRETILDLTPIVPATTSLAGGIQELVCEFAERWTIDLRFDVDGLPFDVEPDAMGVAYAFVQEALTNVRKYSPSHKGTVRLAFEDGGLTIAVRTDEDGHAGQKHGESTGQGLSLMRGRARLLGGNVTSAIDKGGREVVLQIPS